MVQEDLVNLYSRCLGCQALSSLLFYTRFTPLSESMLKTILKPVEEAPYDAIKYVKGVFGDFTFNSMQERLKEPFKILDELDKVRLAKSGVDVSLVGECCDRCFQIFLHMLTTVLEDADALIKLEGVGRMRDRECRLARRILRDRLEGDERSGLPL